MIDGYRIVVVTPAGRKRYLNLLIPQILELNDIVDEYRLWVNTNIDEDIEYMEKYSKMYPDFIKLEYLTVPYDGSFSIHSFFKNCVDPKTIYVRFDDDIVLIDDKEAFINFIKFRIDNPQYFLVYGNILNNAIITYIHQRLGNFDDKKLVGYKCMDDVGWKDAGFTVDLHKQILKNTDNLSTYHFDKWILNQFERVSINCLCWLGSEFALFNGEVGKDEEQWLACDKPKSINKMNVIYGKFVCVHYAFYIQRDVVDKTDILDEYSRLLKTPSFSFI